MKKGIVITALTVILITSVFIFLELTNSYSTPEEALRNINNPKKEVEEVVETIIIDETNTSYVIFHTADDMILVARFDRNIFGWKYADIIGLGLENEFRTGDYIGSKNFYMGGVLSNISKVKLGTKEAELIPLDGTSMQIWILHNTTRKYFKNNDLIFINKEGNEI
jgi:hypothetical protein